MGEERISAMFIYIDKEFQSALEGGGWRVEGGGWRGGGGGACACDEELRRRANFGVHFYLFFTTAFLHYFCGGYLVA
jgi:hypothetical protein